MTIEVQSNEVKAPHPAPAASTASAEPGAQAPTENASPALGETPSVSSEQNEDPTASGTEGKAPEKNELDEPGEKDPEDGSPQSGEPENAQTRKKGGFQRRIDKLNAQKAAAQQEAEYWKREALKNATHDSKQQPNVVPTPAAAEGKPTPDQFDSHVAYVEALTDWKTEQKLKEHDQKLAQSKLKIEQDTLVQTYSQREKVFEEKTSDYREVLAEVEHIRVSPAIYQILVSSENGPEIAYELAKKPEEFERINKLSPLAAAREIGKLEIRISQPHQATKPETKTSKAPNPIAPVGGSGKASVPKTLEEAAQASFSEYKRMRAEQLKKRRQA